MIEYKIMNNNIYTHQNILINTNNKDSDTNLNNDLYIRFPNKLFIKDIAYLSLLDFNLNSEIDLFGNSNSSLILEYTNNLGNVISQQVDFDFSSQNITRDTELAIYLTNYLNGLTLDNYSCVFNVSQVYIVSVITNKNIEVDLSTTTYSITTSNPMSFYFNVKTSIGPILGFGTGIYLNKTTFAGNTTQSISAYNYINCINDSGSGGSNPNYDDLNCKMILYDSNGDILDNLDSSGDASISLNRVLPKEYSTIGDILKDIEYEMNRYSIGFTPNANFIISYDYNTNKITIQNTTGARFGIGFDFADEINFQTSGSLHRILGFRQTTYKHITSITSEYPSRSFMNIFSDDYVLFCSDIINNNDKAVIGLSNNDNINGSNILFAIKYDQKINFIPNNSNDYKIDLSGSLMNSNYKNRLFNDDNPNLVNFYLRLLSGRHISSCISWSSMLKLIY